MIDFWKKGWSISEKKVDRFLKKRVDDYTFHPTSHAREHIPSRSPNIIGPLPPYTAHFTQITQHHRTSSALYSTFHPDHPTSSEQQHFLLISEHHHTLDITSYPKSNNIRRSFSPVHHIPPDITRTNSHSTGHHIHEHKSTRAREQESTTLWYFG